MIVGIVVSANSFLKGQIGLEPRGFNVTLY